MDEEDFDARFDLRPFGTEDVARMENRLRRRGALGIALWGRSAADLQRQLAAPHPQIPSGFDLDDFRDLHRSAQFIAGQLSDPRRPQLLTSVHASRRVFVGGQQYTEWEARCEIVRRAIEYLERR